MVARLKNGPGGGVEGVRAAPEHEAGHGVPVSEEGVQLGDPGGSVTLAALSLQQLLLHLAEVELSQAQPLLLHRFNVFLALVAGVVTHLDVGPIAVDLFDLRPSFLGLLLFDGCFPLSANLQQRDESQTNSFRHGTRIIYAL